MMKRLILIVALVVGLAVAALAVFIATFDADRYRPLVVSRLEGALGKSVQLQRMALGWRHGVALRFQGLTIFEDARAQSEPLLQIESLDALVRLFPLLKKEVQVSSLILLRPRVHVARDAQGRINLLGLAALASPSASLSTSPAAASGQAQGSASPSASLRTSPVSFNVASFQIEDGVIHWTDALAVPPTECWVKSLDVRAAPIAPNKPTDVEVNAALATETPNLNLRARVTLPNVPAQPGAIDRFTLSLKGLPLERILPAAPTGQPQLHGKLTVNVEGSASTFDPAQMARPLSGSGILALSDARVVNLNILRTVLEKLSMIPGLVERLESDLPDTYKAKLAATDTVFSPINVAVRIERGMLQFEHMQLGTDTFRLAGSGAVGVDGFVNVRSTLSIEPTLSAAIVHSVHELQALANPSGEIQLPVTIQGRAPQLAVVPDLNYIASKVIVTKAADLLGRLLQQRESAAEEPARGTEPSQPPDLLGTLLQRALQKRAPPNPQSQ